LNALARANPSKFLGFETPMEIAATRSNQQRAQSRKLFRYPYCSSLMANCGISPQMPRE
jgi:hypothetical protein